MYGFVAPLIRWLVENAARVPAETVGQRITFRLSPLSRAFLLVCLVITASSGIYGLIDRDAFWSAFGWGVFATLIAVWPNVIVADELGITSSQLLRSDRHIQWSEITSARFNSVNHDTKIIGQNDTKIWHSGLHCDPTTLHRLIENRSSIRVECVVPTVLGYRVMNPHRNSKGPRGK